MRDTRFGHEREVPDRAAPDPLLASDDRETHPPLESYGLVGDLRTAALIGANGSLDWLCYPRFDAPSVFGALLDRDRGGFWRIAPVPEVAARQLYLPDTNVLVTRFHHQGAIAELTDFMPVPAELTGPRDGLHPVAAAPSAICRRLRVVTGSMDFTSECRPAFDYARADHDVEVRAGTATFRGPDPELLLQSTVGLERDGSGTISRFRLAAGEHADFVLHAADDRSAPDPAALDTLEQETIDFWHDWVGQCTYRGRWREHVRRSALTLKLLTYAPTGAIVAAVTTSLPEWPGGRRNWDYRYTWLRDAAFSVYALMRIGFNHEAAEFVDFLEDRCRRHVERGELKVMYRVDGTTEIDEHELDHLGGYRQSRPVRIGNAANGQFQLDVYGELIDAVYLYNKMGEPISHAVWLETRELVDYVCQHWKEDDAGIWEVRGPNRPFVVSKVMCWVAIERAIRVAAQRGLPADLERWRETRDAIYEEIMDRGFDEDQGTFVQCYDGEALDAATLLLPLVKFVGPREPRMRSTVAAIARGLLSDPLVRRYLPDDAADDGLGDPEGHFLACSFWLAEATARLGDLTRARRIYETALTFASPLGLFSEEVGPDGEMLGNLPQGLTHLAQISAAVNLDRALGPE